LVLSRIEHAAPADLLALGLVVRPREELGELRDGDSCLSSLNGLTVTFVRGALVGEAVIGAHDERAARDRDHLIVRFGRRRSGRGRGANNGCAREEGRATSIRKVMYMGDYDHLNTRCERYKPGYDVDTARTCGTVPVMNDDDAYAWKTLASETVCRARTFNVTRDHVRLPAGDELDYYVVRAKREAASVVATDDAGRILLVQQWRHTMQRLIWQVPAGAVDDGETPQAAAVRELREESGYAVDYAEPLYAYHPAVGSMTVKFHVFAGRGLRKVGEHDPAEIHAVRLFERSEIEAMIARNEILDGMTLTALLLWMRKS
jgi:8-oxo-dGTP pyrophosphatase MutT (NUDIX family)